MKKITILFSIFMVTSLQASIPCPTDQLSESPSQLSFLELADCSEYLRNLSVNETQRKNEFCQCQSSNIKKIPNLPEIEQQHKDVLTRKTIDEVKDQMQQFTYSVKDLMVYLQSQPFSVENQDIVNKTAETCNLAQLEFNSDICPDGVGPYFDELKKFASTLKNEISLKLTAEFETKLGDGQCFSKFDYTLAKNAREEILAQQLSIFKKSNPSVKLNYDSSEGQLEGYSNDDFKNALPYSIGLYSLVNSTENWEKRSIQENYLKNVSKIKDDCRSTITNFKKLACSKPNDIMPKSIPALNSLTMRQEMIDFINGSADANTTVDLNPYCSNPSKSASFDIIVASIGNNKTPIYHQMPPNVLASMENSSFDNFNKCLCSQIKPSESQLVGINNLIQKYKCSADSIESQVVSITPQCSEQLYCTQLLALQVVFKSKEQQMAIDIKTPDLNLAIANPGTAPNKPLFSYQAVAQNKFVSILKGDIPAPLIATSTSVNPTSENNPQVQVGNTPNIANGNSAVNVKRNSDQLSAEEAASLAELEQRMMDSFNASRAAKNMNSAMMTADAAPERSRGNDGMSTRTSRDELARSETPLKTELAKPVSRPAPMFNANSPTDNNGVPTENSVRTVYVPVSNAGGNLSPSADQNINQAITSSTPITDAGQPSKPANVGLPAKNADGSLKNPNTAAQVAGADKSSGPGITINSGSNSGVSSAAGKTPARGPAGASETEVILNEKIMDGEFVVKADKLKPEEIQAIRKLIESGQPFNIRLSKSDDFKVRVMPGKDGLSFLAPSKMEGNPEYKKFITNLKEFVLGQTRSLKSLQMMFTTSL